MEMNVESIAIRGSLVSPTRLMSPSEVKAATTNHPGLPRPLGGWYLCGDASARIVDAIVRNEGDAAIRLTAYVGPSGGHYMVLTHQLASSQHRFLLPQYEPPVELYLRSLESQPVQVMLGRQGEDDSVMLHNRLPWPHIVPLVEMCQQRRCASPGAQVRLTGDASPLGGVPLFKMSYLEALRTRGRLNRSAAF
jgi:hypothetical protein